MSRIGTDWVSCREHLPLDGVDNQNKFLVRIEERYRYSDNVYVNYVVAEWNDSCQDYYRSMKHDGIRVICYNFDVDWDIDEGQIIEVTHWREIPEVPDVDGKMINFSRITEGNSYDEWYANGEDKWTDVKMEG